MIYYNILEKPIKKLKTLHYKGDFNSKKKTLMPLPDFLIIEDEKKRSFLYRYTLNGEFIGDTWHPNIREAKEQAEYEYADALGEWKEIPSTLKTEDYINYIKNQINKN